MADDKLAKRAPTAEELRAELQLNRRELQRSAEAVKDQLTDWRTYLRRYHLAFVAGAFALGYWIGSNRPRR